MISDEEQFNKQWLETYALVGCKIKAFKDGGKYGDQNIGKIGERDITYCQEEVMKLVLQIYQAILSLRRGDDDEGKDDDCLQFEDVDYLLDGMDNLSFGL